MAIAITDEYLNEKIYSRNDVGRFLYKFYNKVKHGDEEHQKWLKDEMYNFINEEFDGKSDKIDAT